MTPDKPGSRKRSLSDASEDGGERKKMRLEELITQMPSGGEILIKFKSCCEALEKDNEINRIVVGKLYTAVHQMNASKHLQLIHFDDVEKPLKKLSAFIRKGYVQSYLWKAEASCSRSKVNMETTFKACMVSLWLLGLDNRNAVETDDYLNLIVFFLQHVLVENNEYISKMKGPRRKNIVPKGMLLDALKFVSDHITVRTFTTNNIVGLASSSIQTVFHHTDQELQLAALWALLNFYKKGEEYRLLILNLMFKEIGRVPDNFAFQNCPIHETLLVSSFTLLVMSLVENVPILGLYTYKSDDFRTIQKSRNMLQESFYNMVKVGYFITIKFFKKVGGPAKGSKYGFFLWQLLSDLIQVSNEPGWPSARFLLNIFLKVSTKAILITQPLNPALKLWGLNILVEVMKKKLIDKTNFSPTLEILRRRFESTRNDPDFCSFAQRLLISHLNKANSMKLNSGSKLLHGIQWFVNMERNFASEEKLARMIKLFMEYELTMDVEHDMHEIKAIAYYLDTTRLNYVDYDVLLKYVLICCADRNPAIKMKANRSVISMVSFDVDLLSYRSVSKVVKDYLIISPPSGKEEITSVIQRYLNKHPEEYTFYFQYFMHLLDFPLASVQKACVNLVLKTFHLCPDIPSKLLLCNAIVRLIEHSDPQLQKSVVQFGTHLWIRNPKQNVKYLLLIIDQTAFSRCLKSLFKQIMSSSVESVRPQKKLSDPFRFLASTVVRRLRQHQEPLQCLLALSLLFTVSPDTCTTHLFDVAEVLLDSEYSEGSGVELLASELLHRFLPQCSNQDIHRFANVRSKILEKLYSKESLNYPLSLIISFLKLLTGLSRYDMAFIHDRCFLPSLNILNSVMMTNEYDHRELKRALCIVMFLHLNFKGNVAQDNFNILLMYYIDHPKLSTVTFTCLCYLSLYNKSILENNYILFTITRRLLPPVNRSNLTATLYLLLCSFKNVQQGRVVEPADPSGNDSLPALHRILTQNRQRIMDLATDPREDIRYVTSNVIEQILVSGLLPESELVPTILLISSDPMKELSLAGTALLKRIPRDVVFENMGNPSQHILATLHFHSSCLKCDIVRGFRQEGEKNEAICNELYTCLQEEDEMWQGVIDSIFINIHPNANTVFREKLYLVDNLVYFSYRYQSEVYYVLQLIDETLKMVAIPETPPSADNQRRAFVDKFSGVYILSFVKSTLMNYYRFTKEKMNSYHEERCKILVQKERYFVYKTPPCLLPGDKDFDALPEEICRVGQMLRKTGDTSSDDSENSL